jgi:hypothetical protein
MYKYTSAIGSIEMSITKINNLRINPVSKKRISVLISNIRGKISYACGVCNHSNVFDQKF